MTRIPAPRARPHHRTLRPMVLAALLFLGLWQGPAQAATIPNGPSYLLYAAAHGLWSVPVGAGRPVLIAHAAGRPTVRLSSDGLYLLYAFPRSLTVMGRQAGEGWRQLFVCRADGSGSRLVATLPASWFGTRFAWSADDRHVLYARVHATGRPPRATATPSWPWEIRTIDLRTGRARTAWAGRLNRFWPVPLAWRRDRGLIVVVANAAGGYSSRYAVVDTATRRATESRLRGTLTNQVVPSPRQYYTAIARTIGGRHTLAIGLYPLTALHSSVTSVVLAGQRAVAPLHWSLEGGDLAYTTVATSARGAAARHVTFHVLSLSLGHDRVVGTATLRAEILGWSPDGRWLLVRHPTAGGRTLTLLAADGSGRGHRLVTHASLATIAGGFLGWGTSAGRR
ncbi:MAG: hypothetical protein NVSMB65_09250 [Chloroflexota bacterium]